MNKIEKFESIEKFRDFNTLKIIDKDNTTFTIQDKFKDFQEMFTITQKAIKNGNKRFIYSNEYNIYYFMAGNQLVTEPIDGAVRIGLLALNNTKSSEIADRIEKELDKISNRLKDYNIVFKISTYVQLKNLFNTGYSIYKGRWCYRATLSNGSASYSMTDNLYNGYDGAKGVGVYGLREFFENLDNRNSKSLKNMNDRNQLLKDLTIILNRGISEKKYKNLNIQESKQLKDFEVILNYNLLDTGIIIGEENIKKFKNLVKAYKNYKEYISCIYIKEGTLDTVEMVFDTEKIISDIGNKNAVFNKIEIDYQENDLGIVKQVVDKDKMTYYYKNGDREEVNYSDTNLTRAIYYYKNGDYEGRTYKDGILNGESYLKYTDGSIETRQYKNGVLQGEVFYEKDGYRKKYMYKNGIREEMPKLKYYLSIDKERINIDDYRENRLLDPNVGHWDLKEEDKEELKELLGKDVYSRDPKLDINQGGIVGIDFGTKSTVVVYQKDTNNILPMRISGEELNKEARDTDYENPTVIEFRDLVKFKKDYDEKIGRPNTKWEDVTISHTAFRHLMDGTSEQFDSIISDIKQWTVNKNTKIEVIDKKENKISLPPYLDLDLDENSENYIDPVEIYAYYIGSYINTMRNGIYLEYYLSFPVTYEKSVREKILKSFEKGIKKSLPKQIQEDEKIMKKFRVKHGSNEPAAYAVCALKKLKIEPEENEKVYYGVFDFGGGTTDFDFGIWKNSEDEDEYDYELEHFGAGGDIHLGGENILKELAYKVFSNNTSKLRESKIQYIRPEWYPEISGEETLVEYTREAKLNTRKLAEEKLRNLWEEKTDGRIDEIKINLFNADGVSENGIELNINEEELKALIKDKIEKGIKNFFIKLEDAFKDEDVKKVHIFLAGNSCRHSFVNEIFERYVAEMKDKMELLIYDLKAIKESANDSKITGKTGVAYGLIYSRKGGRIKVTNRDEKENVANEINFKFYLGNSKKDKFNPIITPSSSYGKFEYLGILTSDIFEIYYTSSPEAQTGKMEIGKDDPKIKRISLSEEYDEDEKYRIYIKTVAPDRISYAIVKKEEDIETKEIIEEGEVFLD
ncbi:hypothetical protein [Fusobacterium hwasookii]|uniref:Molecular chaperone DnaK n=1 Tax=Fusobacterium hwasookii ChDC F128 TaxID=1216362 RepID=A0ABP2R253_9FUSO|nr:hypothetical protein [Fusobacterium hwasookii]EJU06840.1 hypothetical protein B437_10355 [Fusobacterium hwasookii ChDC F128]